jgi:hypothetical protein
VPVLTGAFLLLMEWFEARLLGPYPRIVDTGWSITRLIRK